MRPDQVLANWRESAAILRAHGHVMQADSLTRFADEIADSLRDYLFWLSEAEACLRSGKRASWFRARWTDWASQDMAEKRGRVRYYRHVRACIRWTKSSPISATTRGGT